MRNRRTTDLKNHRTGAPHVLHNFGPVRHGLSLNQSRLRVQPGQAHAGGHLRWRLSPLAPAPRRAALHPNLNPPRGWRRSSRHPLFMQRSRFARGLRRVYGHARNRSTLFRQTGNMLRETPAAKRAAGGSEQRPEGTGACVSDSERVSAAGLLPL